jgi:DNA replication and repair protein RecF
MKIVSFEARSFRNHAHSSAEFAGGVNVITGGNGAGKTNMLEGIFLFASGKSFRGQKDREIIRFGDNVAYLKLVFEDRFSVHTLETELFKNNKRRLLKDGCEVKKLSEYLGLFRAVIFTPDHLKIVKASPENRRRLMDMAICQTFPRFVASLSEYNRILTQKNNLLRTGLTSLSLPMIDVYNEKLSSLSSLITLNRYNYVSKLGEKAAECLLEMTGCKEKLELNYITQYGKEFSRDKLREGCMNLFERKKDDEINRKMSLYGCHHDDFGISINGKDARLYASQGQQRSIVLSLKLAEGELARQYTGEDGVFLFDDVLSELDEARRKYVTEKLKGRQFIITGCDSVDACDRVFTVEGGNVYVSSSK